MFEKFHRFKTKPSIVHVTTVHPWSDNRIYNKMVKMLPAYGYRVSYIAQIPIDHKNFDDEVTCIRLLPWKGMLGRMLRNIHAFLLCLNKEFKIVHFHDPEFLPFGLLLKLFGKHVVYDIHEDYFLSILQHEYLPKYLRKSIAWIVKYVEEFSVRVIIPVLAEQAYLQRFPDSLLVLNYVNSVHHQDDESLNYTPYLNKVHSNYKRLIYTGVISENRGAYNHVDLLKSLSHYELYMIGRCSPEFEKELRKRAGNDSFRLHMIVSADGMPYSSIENFYKIGGWSWGLALFPDTPHYNQKILTKFYEYMFYEIPILCSSFHTWRSFVESNHVGYSVDEKKLIDVAKYVSTESLNIKHLSMNKNKYTWESQLSKLVKLYHNLI